MSNTVYDFNYVNNKGSDTSLSDYAGQVLLIVNTASKCGFTPQFEGLQEIYDKYKERGLTILGFPCNQFGKQDPGSNSEITEFCQLNYGVNFPLSEKIDVNGSDAHPLYNHLKSSAPGILGSKGIKWNFTKFLVNRQGEVVQRFGPNVTPAKIAESVEALL